MKSFVVPTVFKAIDQMVAPIKAMTRSILGFSNKTQEEVAKMERRFRSLSKTAEDVAKKGALIGAATLAPLVIAARDAITFEDKMADVAKTTNLSGKPLEEFGQALLDMSTTTRTGIDDLQSIAEIGGQLGIAEKDLLGFVDSANKFNVSLGKDFSGGVEEASSTVGTIASLFQQTKDLTAGDALTRIGSAINALGGAGSSTSPVISDFTKRIGALPDALKPAATDVLALGAFFEEAGISSEIAARGFGDIITTAATNLPKFAKQMGISADQAKNLLNSNPAQFAKDFAVSLKGLSGTDTAKVLKSLKIGDTGTIKTVGALGAKVERLSLLQKISNAEFTKGTSLQDEYNKKNNTTAANLAKAQNNLKVFSITAGTLLLPVLNELVKMVVPFIKGMVDWARNNSGTAKTIVVLIGALGAMALVVSAVAVVVKLYADFMLIWAARAKIVTAAQWLWSKATVVWNGILKGVTAAQWLWNAAMTANPIGIVIAAVAALVGVVALLITYWDEWGSTVAAFLGPLGFVVSLIMAFRQHWDQIGNAFRNGGFIEGIKAIGKTILDAMILPIQKLFELIADFTGAKWAQGAAKGFSLMRDYLQKDPYENNGAPVVNPKLSEQNAMASRMESVEQQNVAIDINDNTGRANVNQGSGLVPIKLSSTMAFQ